MEEKLKSISCFDIWVVIVTLFLSMEKIISPNNADSVVNTMSLITSFMFLIGAIIVLIFCSRLKKYRYLLIYDNCTKVTPTLKYILLALMGIAGFFMIYTQSDFIKSSIIYVSAAVILSYRHIDSEDKI